MEFTTDNRIVIDPPKKPKKMTATRFATALGLNTWGTPFEAWCEITRTYQEPFEDTIYTIAGKTIEPKIIDYLNDIFFMAIKDPTEVYGKNYFKQTRGDFFPHVEIFGGMWDAIGDNFVVEIKTTKRSEDWQDENGGHMIPIYYKLQASLYAYLLKLDNVTVTATFLEETDYLQPELFEPSVENTTIISFKISEEFPNFEDDYIIPAVEWWNDHVLTGVSPQFDEKKDAEILKALRTNIAEVNDETIVDLLARADDLQGFMDEAKKFENELKEVKEKIKEYMTGHFRDYDKNVVINSNKFKWTLSKSSTSRVDSNALKKAGIYDQYCKTIETLTLRNSAIA